MTVLRVSFYREPIPPSVWRFRAFAVWCAWHFAVFALALALVRPIVIVQRNHVFVTHTNISTLKNQMCDFWPPVSVSASNTAPHISARWTQSSQHCRIAIDRFLFSTHSQDDFFHERIAKLTGKPREKKWARAARAYGTHAYKPYWLIYQPFFGWYSLSIAHNAREAIRKCTSCYSGSVGQPHPSSGRPRPHPDIRLNRLYFDRNKIIFLLFNNIENSETCHKPSSAPSAKTANAVWGRMGEPATDRMRERRKPLVNNGTKPEQQLNRISKWIRLRFFTWMTWNLIFAHNLLSS